MTRPVLRSLVGSGPVDFYKITRQSTFLAWPVETVEALFSNDDLRLMVGGKQTARVVFTKFSRCSQSWI